MSLVTYLFNKVTTFLLKHYFSYITKIYLCHVFLGGGLFFFLHSFIKIYLIYNELHIFKVYNLVKFELCIHAGNHHHSRDSKHI